ncbi:hypothetical protein [Dokdonella sp.]|jgi:hypothetical protein|uniref:hypothetical protein n=1 Tax=Dokdonella sp. TaxID=2291710 RepID=UPI003BB02C7D
MNKTGTEKDDKSKIFHLREHDGKSRERLIADAATSPCLSSALVVGYFSKSTAGEQSLMDVCNSLGDQAALVKNGDLSHLESMLNAQAVSLNTLFAALANRAAMNMGEHIDATEIYLKLALRAQTQCRATIEALAEIKNPPMVFAKQANIAQGPQQVNNYQDTARAEQIKKPQNELLEHNHDKWLDNGTAATAIEGDRAMETMEALNRATNKGRKGRGKSK